MADTYDAIIVGARVAGAPTAMLLARKGYHVLLVDRDQFPSDTMSTFMVHLPAVARLKQWGLLARLEATGAPAFTSFSLDAGEAAFTAPTGSFEGVDRWYAPRRTVLDALLLEAAREAGVEVRTGFTVARLLREGSRVAGVEGRSPGGAVVSETARIVIGADGMHSRVAREVAAPEYNVKPTLGAAYYTLFSGLGHVDPVVYVRDRRVMGAWSTHGGDVLVFVQLPASDFRSFKKDVEANFWAAIGQAPPLGNLLRGGVRRERFAGTGDLPNFFRQPWGPGWALVGDAGYHKDPTLGHGIMDAFFQADLLAGHLHRGFAGETHMEDALEAYRRERDAHHASDYELITTMADLSHPPPAETRALLAALARDTEGAAQFAGIVTGTGSVDAFLHPENIGAIMARAAMPAAEAA